MDKFSLILKIYPGEYLGGTANFDISIRNKTPDHMANILINLANCLLLERSRPRDKNGKFVKVTK